MRNLRKSKERIKGTLRAAASVSSSSPTGTLVSVVSFIKDVEDRNGDPCLRMQLLAHRQPKSGLQTKLDPKLNVTLHDYQEDSVRWLCDVEMVLVLGFRRHSFVPHSIDQNLLFQQGNTPPNNHFWLQFKATRGGVALWYSPSFYRLRIGNPSNVRGGLLSEEMGLGKVSKRGCVCFFFFFCFGILGFYFPLGGICRPSKSWR